MHLGPHSSQYGTGLDECSKERVCLEIWTMIAQWRKTPRPPHLAHLHHCLADGFLRPQQIHSSRTLKTRPDQFVPTKLSVFAFTSATSVTVGSGTRTNCPVYCRSPRVLVLPTEMLPRATSWSVRVAALPASLTGSWQGSTQSTGSVRIL